MKNILLLLFLLCIVMGCSSTPRYEYETLNLQTTSFIDATESRYVTRSYYLNAEEMYYKYLKSEQINQKKEWSCFDSNTSTNYVAILNRYIPLLRTMATKQRFTIKYRKADGFKQDYHSRTYSEEKMDQLQIESLNCVKKINGKSYIVVSEVYNSNN